MGNQRNPDLKIVVVDDSDFSRKNIINILEKEGFNILGQASSAEEGIKLSVTTDANLFIVDVVMPEKSGIELVKTMTENSYKGYVIMTSSLTMENIVIESLSMGAVDFLKKPFNPDDLIKSVEKIEIQLERDK